jgi:small-conductance mechanosensitive channel/CRP-like cAMP-binding protein
MSAAPRSHRLRQILLPVAVCAALGGSLYYGGNAYQAIGLAALDAYRTLLGYALSIGLCLSLAVLARRLFQILILDGVVASALGTPVPRLLSQISGLLIYVLAISAIFGIVFDQSVAGIWAASGVVSVVIGLALREIILDAFTGLAINLDRPIRIGDMIRVHRTGDEPIEGRVVEISWRATRIQEYDRNIVILSNSRLSAATITNFSMPQAIRRRHISINLDFDLSTERATRVLLAAARDAVGQTGLCVDPPPFVVPYAVTPGGVVEYRIYFFVEAGAIQIHMHGIVMMQVLKHLAVAGIRPAHPKMLQYEAPSTTPTADRPTDADLARVLSAIDLFRDLGSEALQLLIQGAAWRSCRSGAILTQAGEVASAMYLVIEGVLAAELSKDKTATVTSIAPGRLVGDVAMLTGTAYDVTVKAVTDAIVLEFDFALVGALVRLDAKMPQTISGRLGARGASGATGETGRSGRSSVREIAQNARRTLERLSSE